MANFKSVEQTDLAKTPVEPLPVNKSNARVRRSYFSYDIVASGATPASGDTVELVRLPVRARVMGGHFAHDGIGLAGSTVVIGIGGDTNKYKQAVAVAITPGDFEFARTLTEGFGTFLSGGPVTIIATIATADWAAAGSGKCLKGYVEYVVD